MTELDMDAILKTARGIVRDADKRDKLGELTNRIVRERIEELLSLEPDSLGDKEYRKQISKVVAETIENVRNDAPDEEQEDQRSHKKETKKGPTRPAKSKSTENKPKAKRSISKAPVSDNDKSNKDRREKKQLSRAQIIDSDKEDSELGNDPKASSSKLKLDSPMKSKNSRLDTSKPMKKPNKKSKEVDSIDGDSEPEISNSTKKMVKPSPNKSEAVIGSSPSDKKAKSSKPPVAEKRDSPPQHSKVQVDNESDSELSILIDEPPKKRHRSSGEPSKDKKAKSTSQSSKAKSKGAELSPEEETVKRYKSLVFACGIRKVWTKELRGKDKPSEQIAHLRKILTDLGMKGRFSMEQAKSLKAKRDFEQEMADVQEFAQKHALNKRPSRSKSSTQDKAVQDDELGGSEDESDEEQPAGVKRRGAQTARKSIMSFLEDQSDDDYS